MTFCGPRQELPFFNSWLCSGSRAKERSDLTEGRVRSGDVPLLDCGPGLPGVFFFFFFRNTEHEQSIDCQEGQPTRVKGAPCGGISHVGKLYFVHPASCIRGSAAGWPNPGSVFVLYVRRGSQEAIPFKVNAANARAPTCSEGQHRPNDAEFT